MPFQRPSARELALQSGPSEKSAQKQQETREQQPEDTSLPSYRDAMKAQLPLHVTEKDIKMEHPKKQSKMSALKSMLKEKASSNSKSNGAKAAVTGEMVSTSHPMNRLGESTTAQNRGQMRFSS